MESETEADAAVVNCEMYLRALQAKGEDPILLKCIQSALKHLTFIAPVNSPELRLRITKLQRLGMEVSWKLCRMIQEVTDQVLKPAPEVPLSSSLFLSSGRRKYSGLLNPVWSYDVTEKEAWLVNVDRVVAALRWLSFRSAIRHDPSPLTTLSNAVAESSKQKKRDRDGMNGRKSEAEKFHYDLLELLCRHAASGQAGVDMKRFKRAEHEGEDVNAVINDKTTAIVMKRFLVRELCGDAKEKLDALSEEVRQLLYYMLAFQGWTGNQVGALVFAHLLFVMEVDYVEGRVTRIQQSPAFPDFAGSKRPMLKLYDRERLYKPGAGDPDLVFDAHPSEGFCGLVGLVNRMCVVNGQVVEALRFQTDDGLELKGVVGQQLLYSGKNSVVLSCKAPGGEATVLKVQPRVDSQREEMFHRSLDGRVKGVRRMLSCGRVLGAGEELGFVQLYGFGSPFSSIHMTPENAKLMAAAACEAVQGLHECGVLHRDIKPHNFIVVDGRLLLNDFDLSCGVESWERYNLVGTSLFESPRWEWEEDKLNCGHEKVDDWLSLGLTLTYLTGVHRDHSTKMTALRSLTSAACAWAPDVLRKQVELALS